MENTKAVYSTFDEVKKFGKENLRVIGSIAGEVTGRFMSSMLNEYKFVDPTILLQLSMAVAGSITQYLLKMPPDEIYALRQEKELREKIMLENLKNTAVDDLPKC